MARPEACELLAWFDGSIPPERIHAEVLAMEKAPIRDKRTAMNVAYRQGRISWAEYSAWLKANGRA